MLRRTVDSAASSAAVVVCDAVVCVAVVCVAVVCVAGAPVQGVEGMEESF